MTWSPDKMVVVDRPLERLISNVDISVLSEEEVFQGWIVVTSVHVPGPELVVVADEPVHGVPDDQDQLGPVVGVPEPAGHCWGVEVSRSFLHADLSGKDSRHLVNVPVNSLNN